NIVQLLKELISIESVTSKEGRAVEFLANKMKNFGYDEVRIDRAGNLLGRVGSGKTVILYDAHIDTVELGNDKEWGFNPIDPQIRDGYIHGRGVVDDKGCLTGIIYAGKAIKELGLKNDFTLWVSASISEEGATGYGVEAMLKESPDIKPDYVLVAESSESRLIRGHKGKALLRIKVPGKCAHASAAWRGENALIKALPIIDGIDKLDNLKEDNFLGKGTIEVTNVECKTPSLNTIPGEVTIICDSRISCGESIDDLLNALEPLIKNVTGAKAEIPTEKLSTYTGYEVNRVDYYPSWVIPEEHKIVVSGIEAYKVALDRTPVVGKWDFCTNATYLCGKLGIPSLGFGPGDGTLCHSNEEKLSIEELLDAIKFYTVFPFILSK
ncbi:MAG: peptidase dimerization domain protein, partial [Clostridiales bacterium]|nr:peptidase dimerization domain protein [Clostridiales bacterium]